MAESPAVHDPRHLRRSLPCGSAPDLPVCMDWSQNLGDHLHMQDSGDRLQAVFAHSTSVLLPVLGPAVILVLSRRSPFLRAHALAASAASAAWTLVALLIISIDQGRFSVDETDSSGWAVVGLGVALVTVIGLGVINVQRAKQARSPIGWPDLPGK